MSLSESLKEKLKGVCGKNVSCFDIDNFFSEEGVLVDIHSSRQTGRVTLNPKLYGIDVDKSSTLSDFRKEYIKGEKLSFLPLSVEKKFVAIESATRMKRIDLSIGFDGRFMTIESFKEFHKYFKKQQDLFEAHKAYILSNWDKYMIDFKSQLHSILNELNALDKSIMYKQILDKMPSKSAFSDSCKMDIDLMAFPTTKSFNIIDEEISEEMKKSLEKRSINTVNEILGNILGTSFTAINEVMYLYDKNSIFTTVSIKKLKNLGEKISKKNILKHPVINDLVICLQSIDKLTDAEEILERLEECCINIYVFANEVDIKDYLDMSKSFLQEHVLQQLSLGVLG